MNTPVAAQTTCQVPADTERRFAGIARLYGEPALRAFQEARICVVGIGGVGSWVAEALARSGIGELVLVDLDHVSESNTNRQIHALEQDFGKAKVQAMRERISGINAACRVRCIEEFVMPDNVTELIDTGVLDFVVDCVDRFQSKAALISHCRRHRCPMITIGGTGGQRDPSKIRVADLSRSVHDPLLARTRRELRRHHGFRKSGSMGVPCVYSIEQARFPQADGSVAAVRTAAIEGSLHCGGLGSATHLTGSFAFAAVARVLDRLARQDVPAAETHTGPACTG
ncbi:MAG: tRNA threonylcarbamoyladenosine dehydratase [Gammaproteobacteria bacterium]|nr:tRNA threonylcarbamoyladenosine dehydratase [Gammaproteobacteria bacterium]